MPKSLRLGTTVVVMGVLAACSSTEVTEDGGADGGLVETGPPPVPCSRLTTACKAGEKCEGAPDCESRLCREGTCRDVAPADGVKNGDETDVDCGGTASPACPDGKECKVAPDCNSGVCTGGKCQVPTGTDGVQNGDETGVDCGGSTTKAPRCPTGKGCLVDGDCDKVKCDTVQKKCLAPTHDDGITNLDETGIDCGGPTATVKRCATGLGCNATSDCDKVLCDAAAKKCDVPKKDDGIKNGTETDVDCGGAAPTNADKCLVNRGCVAAADCQSGGCSVALGNKCSPKSCGTAETGGITTCGAKETTDVTKTHESCCKSLVLPTRNTRRLDKYEITAGRFRAFISSVGTNVRAWVANYIAANPASQLATLANTDIVDGASGGGAAKFSTVFPAANVGGAHSFSAHMGIDIDNYNGIRGCANYTGNYSANTYYLDATQRAEFGLPLGPLPQFGSDIKPLDCAMPAMFIAFCAWDGGELATLADIQDAWGPATYPWGAVNTGRPTYNWCNGTYQNGGWTCQCASNNPNIGSYADCPGGGFNGLSGSGVFYEWPRFFNGSTDNSPLIAAPGRFTTDATANQSGGESWMDLYGNVAEYTGDVNAAANRDWCDFSSAPLGGATTCTRSLKAGNGTQYTGIPSVGIAGVSWEGHQYGRNSGSTFPATFQYGKFGGRCVRPVDPY